MAKKLPKNTHIRRAVKYDVQLLKRMKKHYHITNVPKDWEEQAFVFCAMQDIHLTYNLARAWLRHNCTNYMSIIRAQKPTSHTYREFKHWVNTTLQPIVTHMEEG